jgi:adenosylhomocysteine nucleosidase
VSEAAAAPRTAVVAALAGELTAVAARLEARSRRKLAGMRVLRGRLGGGEVVVAATGDGAAAAERGVEALLAAEPVDRVLVLGVCGGLSPLLSEGDLVVAREVWFEQAGEIDEAPPPDRSWRKRALLRLARPGERPTGSGISTAGLVSVGRVLADPEAKRAMARRLPAGEPFAADLETAVYARAAAARDLPYLAVRVILDPFDERLPLDVSRCLGADGRVSRARVAARALARPASLAALWDLRRRLRACAERLAHAAAEVVAA